MVGDRHKKNEKALLMILSLLFLMMVALIVVIVVLATRSNYDKTAMTECLKNDDELEAVTCIKNLAFSYYEKDGCRTALKIYDDVPEERFEMVFLKNLYNEAYSMSLSCDESLQKYWKDKYEGIANQLEGRN